HPPATLFPYTTLFRSRPHCGKLFQSRLENDFHRGLGHRFSDVPVDDIAAGAVDDAAQVIEGAADVQIADIDVPVLVGCQRLHKEIGEHTSELQSLAYL